MLNLKNRLSHRKTYLLRDSNREDCMRTQFIDCNCYYRNGIRRNCPRTLYGYNIMHIIAERMRFNLEMMKLKFFKPII